MRHLVQKTLLSFLGALSAAGVAVAQDMKANYLLTRTMLSPGGESFVERIDFHDGLGRPYLTVDAAADPRGPVACLREYGTLGEVTRSWLPVPVQTLRTSGAEDVAQTAAEWHGDDFPYSTVAFDALGRETQETGPGRVWHDAGKSVVTQYLANGANTARMYSVGGDGGLVSGGYYPAGSLSVRKVTDEDGLSLETYFDPVLGKVLERRGADNDTYYVYDSRGRLAYMLQPAYQDEPDLSLYAFAYTYDGRGLLASETCPGCEPVTYEYDSGRRPALTHTPLLAGSGRARFHLYDGLGREVVTGTCCDTHISPAYTATVAYAGNDASVALGGYGAPAGIMLADIRLETVCYYDTYGFIDFLKEKSVVPSADALRSSGHASATGLTTGVLTQASDGQMLCGVLYYDSRGNLTREAAIGLDGRACVTACAYDFAGRMVSSVFTAGTGGDALSVTTSNTYDPSSGRQAAVSHTVSVGGATRSATRTGIGYDGVGRVRTVSRGDKGGTVSTTRNIRGWTSGITGPGFSQELSYTENPDRRLFSSLVSQQTWRDDTDRSHTYTYSYDGLGRLTNAAYAGEPATGSAPPSATGSLGGSPLQQKPADYSESVTGYSPNGSVLGLRRRGPVMNSSAYGLIDDLSLEYEGNRLVRATDHGPRITRYGAMDFADGADEDVEYSYDSSGRLVADANKGISRIEYDEGGYPRLVQFAGGSQTHYVYTPDGRRLRVKHLTAVAGVTVPQLQKIDLGASLIQAADSTDYVGRFVYSDGRPCLCLFDGGYFKAPGTAGSGLWTACHYTRDHLGNVRAVADSGGNILQTLHYYPFGAVISDLGKGHSEQPYQLGGKEIDRMHGLDLSNFGARLYDPALAAWTSPDPHASKYPWLSPMSYCADNPVNAIDPDGYEIKGVTKDDAKLAIKDIKTMFKGDIFKNFRNLIALEKQSTSLKRITDQALSEAFGNVTLNEDQKALVDLFLGAINSKNEHIVEYYTTENDNISAAATNVFKELRPLYDLIRAIPGSESLKFADYITVLYGGALTHITPSGSFTLILTDNSYFKTNRQATLGHEILGHGYFYWLGYTDDVSQHVYPIQTENLILRLMGSSKFRDGKDHWPAEEYIPNYNSLPNYIK